MTNIRSIWNSFGHVVRRANADLRPMCASIIEYNKLITQNRENWQKAFHILDLISAVRLQRTIVSSVAFLFKGSKRLDLLWAMLRSVRLGKLSWIFTNVWRWHVVLGFVLSNGMNQSYLALVWILNLFWCLIRQLDSTDEWSLKRSLQRVKR